MPLVFPVPPLSTASAHLLSLLFAVVYVGSIYLSKNSRLSFSGKTVYTANGRARLKERDEKWRDDPDVIKARLAAVGFATLICCLGVVGIVGLYVGDVDNVSCSVLSTVCESCSVLAVEYLGHTGVFNCPIRIDIRGHITLAIFCDSTSVFRSYLCSVLVTNTSVPTRVVDTTRRHPLVFVVARCEELCICKWALPAQNIGEAEWKPALLP